MPRRKNDFSSWFEHNVDLEHRIVYMGSASSEDSDESGVDYKMAENVIKALVSLDMQAPDGDKPITAILNSPGGEEFHGLAIYDAIKSCRNDVTILVYGMAMSMGSWILQAAQKRVLAPNARVMIHYGTWGFVDHPKIAYRWMEEGKKLDRLMEDTYLTRIQEKHPGFTRKQLQKMLDFDTILNAQEAVELGLADAILGQEVGE
jgi:ATP-dependent Clp protease, protease subunit